jgi:predicted Zn-dependent peptidase
LTHDLLRTAPPPAGLLSAPALPHVTTATLRNGMPAYLIRFGPQPVTEVQLVFRAGHAHEHLPGADDAALRMLTDGTHNYTAQQLAERLDFLGAFFNASSGYEISTLAMSLLSRHLDAGLALLQEIWLHPAFAQAEFDLMRRRELDRLAIEEKKTAYHARRAFLHGVLGAAHPYARVPERAQWQALNTEVLRTHFKNVYRPANAAVIAAGNFDTDELLNLLDAHLGSLQPNANPLASHTQARTAVAQTGRVHIPLEGQVQCSVRVGHAGFARNHTDYHRMRLVTTLLGGYFGSRLMQNIREDKGYTYGIHASWTSLKHAGFFSISTDVGNAFMADTFVQIRHEIDRLRQEPVPQEELDRVRNYLLGHMISEQETPFQIADILKNLYANNLPLADVQTSFAQLQALTPAHVQQLAQQYLQPDSLLEVVCGTPDGPSA